MKKNQFLAKKWTVEMLKTKLEGAEHNAKYAPIHMRENHIKLRDDIETALKIKTEK